MPGKRIPPFAGVCTSAEAERPGLSVAECTRRLRRLAYSLERLCQIAAAHLNSTPEWEAKAALAYHGWLDAEHCTALRNRLVELRENRNSPDQCPAEELKELFDEALWSSGTVELLTAVYRMLRPAWVEAAERYLRESNPLADQPSFRLLKLALAEQREAIAWGDEALATLTSEDPAAETLAREWQQHLGAFVRRSSRLDGCTPSMAGPLPPRRSFREYQPDITPRRDARFAGLFDTSIPADVIYADESRPIEERNLALLFKRLREMDVPEAIAGILAQSGDKPWEYRADMHRQMWDEARHALLGEAGLAAKGVDWTKLPVNITFSYKLARFCTPFERHLLLYGIEQSLMPGNRGKKFEYQVASQSGDKLSATFHDFDWADEVLHAAIGRRHLIERNAGDMSKALAEAEQIGTKLGRALEEHPLPTDPTASPDWWERFASAVLGFKVAPVPSTHVKDYRPLASQSG